MFKYEHTGAYTYAVGDAADAYYNDQQVWCYSSDGTKQLNTFQRELVHILPGYVVVFDRVTPVNSGSSIRSNFHYRNEPVITGDLIEATNGDGKVFHKVLWPTTASIQKFDVQAEEPAKRIEVWRVEVEDGAPKANYQYMHVFYITDAGVTSMPDAVKVNSESGNMIGTRIMDPVEDIILFFSSDPNGTPPAGNIIYEVGMERDATHRLFNLLPMTEYNVEVAINHRVHRITVRRGKGQMTTEQGVLEFHTDAGVMSAARE